MDDTRIRELTDEVLRELRTGSSGSGSASPALEARVAALEAMVARLAGGQPVVSRAPEPSCAPVVTVMSSPSPSTHPALQTLRIPGPGTEHCVLEPDKACCNSGRCRTFGY